MWYMWYTDSNANGCRVISRDTNEKITIFVANRGFCTNRDTLLIKKKEKKWRVRISNVKYDKFIFGSSGKKIVEFDG